MIAVTHGLTATSAENQRDPQPPRVTVYQVAGSAMGMEWSVRWTADLPRDVVEKETRQVLSEIEAQMSTYRADSEISRFNFHAETNWFSVSTNLAHVAGLSLNVARRTDGALDPTVYPLIEIWGFGLNRKVGHLPTVGQISAAKARVGYTNLQARLDPPALRKLRPDVAIDVNAVAMGYAADVVARRLGAAGCVNYLVDMGGEFAARGTGPEGRGWLVGIEQPDSSGKKVRRILPLFDECLATSGDDRNFREINGRRYHHIMDPRTGWPAELNVASATVIRSVCAEADAWATAAIVLGASRALEAARTNDLKLILIERAEGGYRERVHPSEKDLDRRMRQRAE